VKQKTRKVLLMLSVVTLSLIILAGLVPPKALAQIARGYFLRSQYFVEYYLQNGEVLPSSAADLNLTTPITPTETIMEMLAKVDRDRAEVDLRRLTGEEPLCIKSGCYTITHRLTGSQELEWTMEYLYENLDSLGYTVRFADWSNDRNLIATKTGVTSPTEEIYLVAHVDGVRQSTERYPAADDNASSVVNGLELARVFSNYSFDRTIVLFFSTGEEQGTRGVREYLNSLSSTELAAIKYVINRDVTGYDANGDGVMELVHGSHPPSVALAQVMSEAIDAYQLNLDQRMIVGCP
jgi:hypothetical protein